MARYLINFHCLQAPNNNLLQINFLFCSNMNNLFIGVLICCCYKRCRKQKSPRRCRKDIVLMKPSPIYIEPTKDCDLEGSPLMAPIVEIKPKKWNGVKSDLAGKYTVLRTCRLIL